MKLASATRSLLPRREKLGAVADTSTLLIHAAYPSATRTLCGLSTLGGDRGGPSPTCPTCIEVAAIWNPIDRGGG